MLNVESKYARINGIKIHYVEQGSGQLVLLLHGFPEFWYGWRKQIPELSKHFRIVAPDMRGYNLSDKPKYIRDYNIEILAKDVADLIAALGAKTAVVVGHDWGGAVAWAVASLYPEVVHKLVILNATPILELRKLLFSFKPSQWSKNWYIFFFQLPFLPEKIIGTKKFFQLNLIDTAKSQDEDKAQIMKIYLEAFAHRDVVKSTIAYYRAAFRAIFPRPKINFPKVKAPVMTIWGELDIFLEKKITYNTALYCENFSKIIYVPNAGHFVHQDDAALVNQQIINFCKD
jgi:epoxide hydrolase 4